MVRREGFEPPAFWSVGCLTHKSEPFRLRFVLFATVRSADFPLFPSSPARFFRILGQNWVKREDSIMQTINEDKRFRLFSARSFFVGIFVRPADILRKVIGDLFRRVCLVCDPLSKAECVPAFGNESEREPFVREVEKRNQRWPEIELLLIVRVHREPGNVCI